ncbi:MAG TPA: endonuclease/exonuclease/phosphatase family protein [Spirochaetota bacterium]|nr:endonuclease/exonuclease/phosphatase family protein [Spirochaetota bacterium]
MNSKKMIWGFIVFIIYFLSGCSTPDFVDKIENLDSKKDIYLSDLIIEGFELEKTFPKDNTSCALVVPYKTESIKIYPVKNSDKEEALVKLNGKEINSKKDFFKLQKYYICEPLLDSNKIEISYGEKNYELYVDKEVVVKIASWNIANLSNSKSDYELTKISSIVGRYDLIAVQEVNDTLVLERIKALIPDYDYVATDGKVGSGGYAEYYCYFYKKSAINFEGASYLWNDESDWFVREPFIADFKAGNFSFTMINIHILYGNNETERRVEIQKLDDVIEDILIKNPDEKDLILVGDFNFSSDDIGWEVSRIGYTHTVDPTMKTTIKDVSSYDNLWYNPVYTKEFKELYEIYKFDEEIYLGDYSLAEREVSDHRPIGGIFIVNQVDAD